jgi:hypothetical protein
MTAAEDIVAVAAVEESEDRLIFAFLNRAPFGAGAEREG